MGDWIGHILHRNYLLKHVIEGKLEGTGRRRRRRKQQLDELKEMRRYWKLSTEKLDRLLRRYWMLGTEKLDRLCGDVGFEEAIDLS
jgi:hypothetical protein